MWPLSTTARVCHSAGSAMLAVHSSSSLKKSRRSVPTLATLTKLSSFASSRRTARQSQVRADMHRTEAAGGCRGGGSGWSGSGWSGSGSSGSGCLCTKAARNFPKAEGSISLLAIFVAALTATQTDLAPAQGRGRVHPSHDPRAPWAGEAREVLRSCVMGLRCTGLRRPTVCSGPASNAARTRSAHFFSLMPKREHWHTNGVRNPSLVFRQND
eukprot:scaffold6616_cov64-Phaeocystis_antarctica.AAC.6